MDSDKQPSPALIAGGGAALLAGLVLHKKRKAKRAAKRAAKLEAARAKAEAQAAKKPRKAKKEKRAPRAPKPTDVEMVEKRHAGPSDNLLRDILIISAKYKLKSRKKRTKPLALVILLYLVEQIYREWERPNGRAAEGEAVEEKGKKKGKRK